MGTALAFIAVVMILSSFVALLWSISYVGVRLRPISIPPPPVQWAKAYVIAEVDTEDSLDAAVRMLQKMFGVKTIDVTIDHARIITLLEAGAIFRVEELVASLRRISSVRNVTVHLARGYPW